MFRLILRLPLTVLGYLPQPLAILDGIFVSALGILDDILTWELATLDTILVWTLKMLDNILMQVLTMFNGVRACVRGLEPIWNSVYPMVF